MNYFHSVFGQVKQQETSCLILKDEFAKNNYKEAHEAFIKTVDESIRLTSGKKKEELIRIKNLWEEDHKLKTDVQNLASAGKMDEAINLLTKDEVQKWRELRGLIFELIKTQKSIFSEKLENFKTC